MNNPFDLIFLLPPILKLFSLQIAFNSKLFFLLRLSSVYETVVVDGVFEPFEMLASVCAIFCFSRQLKQI